MVFLTSMDPLYSVIIPTYRRLDVLPEVLEALDSQIDAPTFEVIVIDDGSEDETWDWLQNYKPDYPFRAMTQANAGPARARNRGVALAQGQRVAILGDDTVPDGRWLGAHHRRFIEAGKPTTAVIGYTGWHSRMRRTAFLDYINEYGLQFGYALIEDHDRVPFNFFYTSNLSLSRELLEKQPFNESFPYAAWEDIEAAYRLWKQEDMNILYAPKARVAHDHPTDLDRFKSRQEKAGYSAVVFYLLHPELGSFLGLSPEGPPSLPGRRKQQSREWLAWALQKTPMTLAGTWNELLRFHYIRGLQRGWRERVLEAAESKSA